jgi:hypothetical protein
MSNVMLALGGAIIASVFWVVIMGVQFHNWHEKCEQLKADLFKMEEQLLDALEGQVYPKYVMRSDGVDSVVERKRPDSPRKVNHTPDGTSVLDLTGVDDE